MQKSKINFISVYIIISLFAIGLFHEFLSCIASVALCVYIAYKAIKNRDLILNINLTSISVALIVLGYGVTALWAVDSGAAVIGFFKFLPILLFMIAAMQSENSAEEFLKPLPYASAVMTLVSALLMQIPPLEKYFSVAGRLSGTLQYSNTFALLLLVSLIIIATKEKYKAYDYISIPVLVFGILYSGSRTVFVLTAIAVLALIIFSKNKKAKISLAVSAAVIIVGAVIFAAVTDNFATIGRFLTMSLNSSTFLGRFLYFRDALTVIIKHPFGTGYMGFYYLQQSVQTGVYSVKSLHNDFLQLMIDVGWIPAIVFISAIVKSFFKKGTSLQKRLLLFVFSAHCCFDFDLQFAAMFMIFVLLLDYKEGKEISFDAPAAVCVILSVIALFSSYIGVAQTISYCNKPEISSKIYPWNTQDDIALLSKTDDTKEMQKIADRIINRNKYASIAYSAKALCAYSEGDFEKVIKYKSKAIELAPFAYAEYEDYGVMLINGIEKYRQIGDGYSANVCRRELIETADSLEKLPERLSKLGAKIDDQPQTELPAEVQNYINMIR